MIGQDRDRLESSTGSSRGGQWSRAGSDGPTGRSDRRNGRSDRATRLRILVEGIRARPASSVMLFIVATVAVGAAAIGPMFLQSADRSVFASTIAAAPPGEASISVISDGGVAKMARLRNASQRAVSLGNGLIASPVLSVTVGARFAAGSRAFGGQEFETEVLARTDICAHLDIVVGHCPDRSGQVLISKRSATASDEAIGSRVTLTPGHAQSTSSVTVVGLYEQPSSVDTAYWADNNVFAYGSSGPQGVVELDPFVSSLSTPLAMSDVTQPQLEAVLNWRRQASFDPPVVLESTAGKIQALLSSGYGLQGSTQLASIVSRAARDDDLMSSIALAMMLQLVLLTVLILYTLGRSIAMSRRPEAEFARRHGFPRSALIALAVGEPAVLVVAALPFGLLLAWGILELAGRSLFVSGTPASLNAWSFAAAFGAVAAGIFATMFAGYELWQRPRLSNDRRAGTPGAVVDAIAIALALAGLIALAAKGSLDGTRSDPLASLAPGLLALGAGVIGVRLATLLVRVAIRRSRDSVRVPWFLAVRQVGRRPSSLRQALALTLATAVVLFAVGTFFLASNNRSLVANFQTGSASVVRVTPPSGANFIAAVRRADPSGHEAMAVADYSSSSGNLLAVDSSRLPYVLSWPDGLTSRSAEELAKRLSPSVPPGVTFAGSELRLTLQTPNGTPPLELSTTVFDETYDSSETIDIGPVVSGLHDYTASLDGVCAGGCRLLAVDPEWYGQVTDDSGTVDMSLRAMSVDRANGPDPWVNVPFGGGEAKTWSVTPSGVHVSSSQRGEVAFAIPAGLLGIGGTVLSPVDLPRRIPAIVSGDLEQLDAGEAPGQLSVQGLDGNPLSVEPVAVVSTLPAVGADGAIVDLDLAQRAVTSNEVDTTFEVFMAPGADSRIIPRLRAQGFAIGSTTFASDRLGVLDHSGLSLVYDLVLIVSPVAALLAIGTVAFLIVTEGRRRRYEITSLELVGVPEKTVRRSLLIENAVVLAIALIVGAGVGFAAESLALGSLPEFVNGTAGIPVSTSVPLLSYFVTLLLLAITLGITAFATTRSVIREARRRRPDVVEG